MLQEGDFLRRRCHALEKNLLSQEVVDESALAGIELTRDDDRGEDSRAADRDQARRLTPG